MLKLVQGVILVVELLKNEQINYTRTFTINKTVSIARHIITIRVMCC